jgi:hypothetical protein
VTVRHLDLVDAAQMFAAADTDGNPATDPDPSWVPLRPDPAYPEYPSGYNGFAAAVSRALENLFHTRRLQLTLTSTGVPGVQRHYHSGGAPRPGTWGSGSRTGPSTTTSSPSTATAGRDGLGGVSDRQVVVRQGRRLGWWIEGRAAGGRLFMKTWWPTQGLGPHGRPVVRLAECDLAAHAGVMPVAAHQGELGVAVGWGRAGP